MKNDILKKIEEEKPRSAWGKGVKIYALELASSLGEETVSEEALLNGANSWSEYSWAGNSLCSDCEIAARLCSPSELKKVKKCREEWFDVQARALGQAARIVLSLAR